MNNSINIVASTSYSLQINDKGVSKKSKQSNLAKELKRNKELEFITANIKQLNNHLQLENNDYQKEIMVNAVNKIADEYPAVTALSENQKIWKFYL